ncbi:MAG: hypothetical protein GX996_02585 [Firmicutes bacterium]|nr:hypothetical protein [Bacillota bacterium]
MMRKSTLTIYLPQETFEQAKIAAVKADMSFSDLARGCVLAMIGAKTFDQQLPKPHNDNKTMIYLTENEKTKIKLFAANQSTTLSQLIYQALERYMTEKIELPPKRKKQPEKKERSKPEHLTREKYTYHLTEDNSKTLRIISAKTGKTRTQLILDALKNSADNDILETDLSQPFSERSSMNLSREELSSLKEKAERLNLTLFELFNRALKLYY